MQLLLIFDNLRLFLYYILVSTKFRRFNMLGICTSCILFRNGFCFSQGEPEKLTGETIKCDYYLFSRQR